MNRAWVIAGYEPPGWQGGTGGGGDVSDYEKLGNLPKVNGVTLVGDRSADELGLASKESLTPMAGKTLPLATDNDVRRAVGTVVEKLGGTIR